MHETRQAGRRADDQPAGQPLPARPSRQEAHLMCRRHRHHAVHGHDGAARSARVGLRAALRRAAPHSHGAYWQGAARALRPHRIKIYCDDGEAVIPLDRLLDNQPLGTHLYVCGPAGMIDWRARQRRASSAGRSRTCIPSSSSAPPPGKRLRGHARRQARRSHVGAAPEHARGDRGGRRRCALSLPRRRLRPVRDRRRVAATARSCTTTTSSSADDKASGKKIMLCVSRFEGNEV